MCVAQFREYTQAFSHKHQEAITKDDAVQKQYGTYYGNGRAWHYTMNTKKMRKLRKDGNRYALNEATNTEK